MKMEDREQRLVDLVIGQRDEECLALLDRARDESMALLEKAHGGARRHVHEAAEAERRRARSNLRSAKAELETLKHRHEQQLSMVLLQQAWQRLPTRLAQRWTDAGARKAWIEAALKAALQHLPEGQWRIVHAPNFSAEDEQRLRQSTRFAQAPILQLDETLDSGLIIHCGGVSLDASGAGLLRDKTLVEARLLALLEAERHPERQP
jgi:hypothetical protein